MKKRLFSCLAASLFLHAESVPTRIEEPGTGAEVFAAKSESSKTDAIPSPQASAPAKPFKKGWDGMLPPRYGNGGTAGIEFLWWTVAQEASEFVVGPATVPVNQQAAIYLPLGPYRSATFDWNPGFRVYTAYTFKRDVWQLLGEYTYYHTRGKKSIARPQNNVSFLNATFGDISLNGLQLGISRMNLTYNALDVLIGRRFLVSQHVLFKFSLGATGAWIRENWAIAYLAVDNGSVLNNWHFEGGGVKAKLDSRWHLGSCVSLFGDVSGAVLLAHYYNRNALNSSNPGIVDRFNPLGDTTYQNTIITPMTQIALGFDWEQAFQSVAVRAAVSVEASVWFDLQQAYKGLGSTGLLNDRVDLRNTANLNLYGVTTELGFSF